MSSQKHIIIVLGMHRSGTSAITRGLQALGVNLGTKLIDPAIGENDKGFFEDKDFLELNEELLQKLDYNWNSLGTLPLLTTQQEIILNYQEKLSALLVNRLENSNLYGIKDPRFSKLLPLIKPVLQRLKLQVSYIIASRNPLSVANSLLRRNQIPIMKTLYLWLEHLIFSLEHTNNEHRLVVDFDLVLADTKLEIKRIANFLELNNQISLTQIQEYEKEFLDPSLRHSQFSSDELNNNQMIPKLIVDLYQLLLNSSSEENSLADPENIINYEKIIASYREILPALNYLQIVENQKLSDYENLTAKIKILELELADQNQKYNSLNLLLAEEIHLKKISEINLSESNQKIAKLSQELQAIQATLNSIFTSRSWQMTKPLRKILVNLRQLKNLNNKSLTENKTPNELEFMFIAEAGILEEQALLLATSIRKYTGRYRTSPITVISPRAINRPSTNTIASLKALAVNYLPLNLDSPSPEYLPSYRILASTYFEKNTQAKNLAVLDSDTFFIREPDLELGEYDVALRPVDIQGICSTGPSDPKDQYWQKLCECCHVNYESIPTVTTTVDQITVKASYNGGFIITKKSAGIFERTENYFRNSLVCDLVPSEDSKLTFNAGHGTVTPNGSKYWGSSQACLSLAIWGSGLKVKDLSATHNLPLNFLEELKPRLTSDFQMQIAHIHYHHLFSKDHNPQKLFENTKLLPEDVSGWLFKEVPFRY